MNMTVMAPAIITVTLAVTAAVSPFTVPAALEELEHAKIVESRIKTAQTNLDTTERFLVSTVQDFNDKREFSVYYGDIPSITKVLGGVAGIETQNIYEVDPMDDFADGPVYGEGSKAAAVRYEMVVADPLKSLEVFAKMELPIHSVSFEEPNKMSVVFMTGGEI